MRVFAFALLILITHGFGKNTFFVKGVYSSREECLEEIRKVGKKENVPFDGVYRGNYVVVVPVCRATMMIIDIKESKDDGKGEGKDPKINKHSEGNTGEKTVKENTKR